MPLFGWKSRWNRRPDQIYMSVTGKDDKASDESETLHDSRGGRGDEIRKLRRRVRLSMGLWAVTAAGLLFIFFTRPSSTERPPLLMTPVPSRTTISKRQYRFQEADISLVYSPPHDSHIRTRPHLRNSPFARI